MNHHSELVKIAEPVLMAIMIMELMLHVKDVVDFVIPVKPSLIYVHLVLIQNIEQEVTVDVLMDGIVMAFHKIVYLAKKIVKLVQDQKHVIFALHIQIDF
jgi:hypothetical protein